MKQSTFFRLVIITLLLVGLTLFSLKTEEAALSTGNNEGNMLIPNLATSAVRLDRIAVGRQNKILHIKKKDDETWVLKEKNNHPVSIAIMNKTLDSLAQSEMIAQKTADPKRLKQLGLTDKLAVHLKLYEEDADSPAIDLLIGRFAPDLNGTYVKYVGEDKSWLASGNLVPPIESSHWLEQRLFALPPTHIRNITIETFEPEGKVVTLERPTLSSLFSINGTPSDTHDRPQQYALTALLRGLSDVVFYDVLPHRVITKNPRVRRYTIDTFDGLRITMSMHHKVHLWTEITAEFKPDLSLYEKPTGIIAEIKNARDRENKLRRLRLLPPELTKKRVKAMNAKSEGWAYQMPSGILQMITKDLVE